MSEGSDSPEFSGSRRKRDDTRNPFSQEERQRADQIGAKHVSSLISDVLNRHFQNIDPHKEEEEKPTGVDTIKVEPVSSKPAFVAHTREELEQSARQRVGGESTERNIVEKIVNPPEIELPAEPWKLNLLREIKEGKTWAEFGIWIKDRTRRAEVNNEFNKDTIQEFVHAINNYEFVGARPNPEDLDKLVKLVEIRGTLSYADQRVRNYDYKEFVEIMNLYFDDSHLKVLWTEQLESGKNVIHILTNIIETRHRGYGGGQEYWAMSKSDRKAFINRYLGNVGIWAGRVDRDKKIEELQDIVEKLFHVTGMSAFYTGPIDADGNLVDKQIMDEIAPSPGDEKIVISDLDQDTKRYALGHITKVPDILYWRNELYFDKWWEKRRIKNIHFPHKGANPHDVDEPFIGDPSGGMRRVLYIPEELNRMGTTKAESLRYATEGYVRTLPQLEGKKTLREYMQVVMSADGTQSSNYMYISSIAGAGELFGGMNNLITEPIKGGENAGDLSKLGDNLKPLTDVIGGFQYLQRGTSRNILYYATSGIMEATFKWVNSGSREKEFRLLPRFKKKIMNSIFHAPALEQFMNVARRGWALRGVGASDEVIVAILTKEALGGLLGDILRILSRAIISGK